MVPPPLAELTARAQTLTSAGDLVGARRVLANVLNPADAENPRAANPDLAMAAALHARILIALGDPHSARIWAGFAHAAEERLHGPHDERTVAAAATHAAVLQRVGHYGRAAQVYHQLVGDLAGIDGPDSPRVLAAEADLSTAEHASGQCTAARSRLAAAWQRYSKRHGDADPAGIKMLARLGAMERECGLVAESRDHLAQAQAWCARFLPADHPLVRQVTALAVAPATGRHVCGRVQQSVGPQEPQRFSAVSAPGLSDAGTPGADAVGPPPAADPVSPPPDAEAMGSPPGIDAGGPPRGADAMEPPDADAVRPRGVTDVHLPGVSTVSPAGVSIVDAPGVSVAGGPGVSVAGGPGVSVAGGPGVSVAGGPGMSVAGGPGMSVAGGPGVSVAGGPGAGNGSSAGVSNGGRVGAGPGGTAEDSYGDVPGVGNVNPPGVSDVSPPGVSSVSDVGPMSPAGVSDVRTSGGRTTSFADPGSAGAAGDGFPPDDLFQPEPGHQPPADERPTVANGVVFEPPLYLSDAHRAPGDLTGRHARTDVPAPLPGRRAPVDTRPLLHGQRVPDHTRPFLPGQRLPDDTHSLLPGQRVPDDMRPPLPGQRVPDDSHSFLPGWRGPDYSPDDGGRPPGSASAGALARPRNTELVRPDMPESAPRRRQPFLLAGVAVAAVAAGVAALVPLLPNTGEKAAGPAPTPTAPTSGAAAPAAKQTSAPATAQAPALDPGAPQKVRLQDNRDSVALRWTYPKDGEGPVLVSGGRAGQQPRVFQQLSAGSADYVVYGLNENQNYCFTVAIAYSTDRIATSAAVCTSR